MAEVRQNGLKRADFRPKIGTKTEVSENGYFKFGNLLSSTRPPHAQLLFVLRNRICESSERQISKLSKETSKEVCGSDFNSGNGFPGHRLR